MLFVRLSRGISRHDEPNDVVERVDRGVYRVADDAQASGQDTGNQLTGDNRQVEKQRQEQDALDTAQIGTVCGGGIRLTHIWFPVNYQINGCCCVTQWIDPSPQMSGMQSIGMTLRPGKRDCKISQAFKSFW